MNIVSIPFKGAQYMCIKGSKRAYALKAANYAFDRGERDLADALCAEALKLSGCAFDARQAFDVSSSTSSDPLTQLRNREAATTYADICFAALVAENNS